MSNPVKHGHQPEHAEYEREDLTARSVFTFLIGLVVLFVVVIGILKVLTGGLNAYNRSHQPPQNPLVAKKVSVPEGVSKQQSTDAINADFPKPRLEEDELGELNSDRMKQDETLASYGWVDQGAGTVHIPIERAMELTVQRGLPTQVRAEVTPASAVNTSEQAAAKADTATVKTKAKKKK